MYFSELVRITNQIYDRMMTPIEKAKKLGTLNQVDRSKQYEHMTVPELMRAVNEAWAKIRICEKAIALRDQEIDRLHAKLRRYQVKHTVLVAIITGLAWEGVKALTVLVLR